MSWHPLRGLRGEGVRVYPEMTRGYIIDSHGLTCRETARLPVGKDITSIKNLAQVPSSTTMNDGITTNEMREPVTGFMVLISSFHG